MMKKMERRIYSFLIAALHIVSWVSAASIPFAPQFGFGGAHQKGQILQSLKVAFSPNQGVDIDSMETLKRIEEEEAHSKWVSSSTLGSRPPICEHKCGGCRPCIPIQVPTSTEDLRLQYANYEPGGWKCKCGNSFFNP